MGIYFLIAAILLLGALLDTFFVHKSNTKISILLYGFFSLLLILLAGGRMYVGYDYGNYQQIFRIVQVYVGKGYNVLDFLTLKQLIPVLNVEPFYLMLNAWCNSFEQTLMIMAILGVGVKSYAIFQYTNHRFVCLFLYFCEMYISFEMGIMRQGVAMGFMMLALFSLRDDKIKNFFIYILIGACFHASSLLMIPIYYIRRMNYKYLLAALIPSTFLFFFNLKSYLYAFVQFLFLERISSKLSNYIGDFNEQYGLLIRMVLVLFFFVFAYKYWNLQKEQYIFINTFLYGVIFALLFYNFSPALVIRGTAFFYFSHVFILDLVLQESRSKNLARTALLAFTIVGLWHIYALVSRNPGIYFPYHNYLFN